MNEMKVLLSVNPLAQTAPEHFDRNLVLILC